MSNTIRIRTTPNGGDKYLKVKLEQDFDFIEILSLKISQEESYRRFCSDYGVIVGRVVINSGFGVPNAKVSVFIPIDDVDKDDPVIKGLYPYEVITDKDSDGIRYNLFPKENTTDNECYTPIGTFPTKREILDNDDVLNVYCKYYKFTTTTNHAGDFMIFGVPNGTYQVHVDADISDIGIASQRPYDLISQGTPAKLFDSANKFKGGTNLNKLIQVKSANAGVNVQPFWGDTENCEIGITRIDFDLNYNIRPAAIFMGSIYGDQDKHSINKRCRPRKKLGLMCEQVTGPGSINMIRKTLDGDIEDFDVEGGRVIDDDGTWAYQIPMNLDYMVTDEVGNLVLSQDPNKGIPTRARVRFNIGMDETGGEGRLRTRARYLVPNNPKKSGVIDYSFDETTNDASFVDLFWNKIYTVSNFISRFQRNVNLDNIGTRSITGMKSVDECAGDKTPFPYNRVDTELNPIFFIICLIIKIIGIIIYMINAFFIPIINFLILAVNTIMNAIVSVVCGIIDAINSVSSLLGLTLSCGLSWTNINYVGCITVTCPADDGDAYAPGCNSGSYGFGAAAVTPTYYPNDPFGHSGLPFSLVGLDDCLAFEMAKSLGLFHFDFYNDWVNGTLFGYLLKYKKKKNKREVFCEYDCADFGGGVDGNQNGIPDNDCHTNLLLDTCYSEPSGTHIYNAIPNLKNQQKAGRDSGPIRDGLIKKVGSEFFYASTTHDLRFNLFATDVVCIGSVFNCDWQGIQKLQPLTIPTTYKLPPDTQEVADDNTTVEACGMVGIGGNTKGLFFEVNCLGVHVDDRQCLNIRHICEMGVEIDQAIEDPNTGAIISPSDCVIGISDIDDAGGRFYRDVFTGLNSGTTMPYPLNINGYTTDFNLSNAGVYDFASVSDNGVDYIDFRGWQPSDSSSYGQPKHSYYFYFGILPGKTAVEKMNQRFFNHCNPLVRDNFLIQASSTVSTSNNGTITFSFFGGVGPYTYSINGGPTSTTTNTSPTVITGLPAGTYVITATDANGNPVTTTVVVSGPPSLYGSAIKIQDSSGSTSYSGIINITAYGGGTGPYTCQLKDHLGTIIYPTAPLTTVPTSFTNLAPDSGYTVTICDTLTCVTINNIAVFGPNVLSGTKTSTNVSCFNGNNGTINVTATGGVPPISYYTTGPFGYTSTSNSMSTLIAGTYTTTITDGAASTFVLTTVLTQPAQLSILTPVTSELNKQCDPNYHYVPFYIANTIPAGPVNAEYSLDGASWIVTGMTYVNQTTPLYITVPNGAIATNIRIRFSYVQGSSTCYSNTINIPLAQIALPPALLTISTAPFPPQCTPLTAIFNVNISHLVRAPYTINWNVVGGGSGTVTTSSNPTLLTLPVPAGYPSTASITLKVTDSKGCVSPTIPVSIQVPQVALAATVTTTGPLTSGPNTGKYQHVVSASGGIPSYTGTGTFYDTNTTYTAIVTDSQGCSVTVTG